MIGIYLLVTLFTQLTPQNLFATLHAPTATTTPAISAEQISVSFEKLNGVKLGSPVLAKGQLVGTVTDILAVESSGEASTGFSVRVQINADQKELLKKGTVALAASPLAGANTTPKTVVELLIPPAENIPALSDGDRIVGYATYEDFWSADFREFGLKKDAFRVES